MIRSFRTEPKTSFCYLALGAFTVLLMASFILADQFAPAGRRLAKVTGVDPPAYFGVAHSLLFDRDFDLSNEFRRVPPDDNPWTAVRPETGHPGSAYAIGYSLLAMPFLAAGTLVDVITGHPADGFSRFAILGYCLANVVLICLGLMALFTLLRGTAGMWGVSGAPALWYALFATGSVFFGTTVAYYAFSQLPHAATFFGSSMFVALWWKVRDRTDVRSWALAGLLGGLLSISRWQEMFFVGAPFVFDLADKKPFREFLPWLRSRMAYAGAVALCWIPQLLEWKYIYGKFFTNPYGKGVLILPPPWIPQMLFSSRNGWFVWTPLALLGVGGLLFGLVKAGRVYLPWLVVITLEVALISSAPVAWNSGDMFGSRYMTSSAPLVGLGLVTILYAATRRMRGAVVAAAAACCLFTSLFAVQFRLDLIPRHQRLTIAECFTDKLRLPQVRQRKQAVQKAQTLLQQGSPGAAVEILERAAATYGDDRDVLAALREAYRTTGATAKAEDASRRWEALMQARLW